MDSLTQITLGAAVGEAVLGRKVGNRAMLWGAIAGTIPDLDVLSNLAGDELSSLAFHRAITHSLTFAVVAPLLLGFLVQRLYDKHHYWHAFLRVWLGMVILIGMGAAFMPIPPWELAKITLTVSAGIMLFPTIIWVRQRFRRKPSSNGNASWKQWAWLFFWSIVTHPLLDCCTTYGTQLFQPFLDYRAAFNNISVVDPLYTLPFLLFLLLAFFAGRRSRWRPIMNYIGISISSAYMLFTIYNKVQVDRIFEASLQEQGIPYQRYMTSPTILNNILWQGIAEGDTAYYHGMYSILDQKDKVLSFVVIPKNHHLVEGHEASRPLRILSWFSDGYFSILKRDDGQLQFNDLRFGSLNNSFDKPSDFVFHFILKVQDSELTARQSREPPPDTNEALASLWERIKGI